LSSKTAVAIIGVGLIGGSLGKALRRSKRYSVIGIGRRPESLNNALSTGAVDRISTQFSDAAQAQIVVLATPVSLIVPTLKRVLPVLKPGTIVTDVGSVKGSLLKDVQKTLRRKDVHFIGAHPLAGSHRTGVMASQPTLFKNATCVVIPGDRSATAAVSALWKAAGARVLELSAAQHDQLVAVTSHLPHLLAHALVHTAARSDDQKKLQALMAGSFRDMTRVASADPDQWVDIFEANAPALRSALRAFLSQLSALSRQVGRSSLRKTLRHSHLYRQPLFRGL